MSSDRRWTGGLANRQWQRGIAPPDQPMDWAWVVEQVLTYIRDCKAAGISDKYHPTAGGALKVVFHRGGQQRAQIVRAFNRAGGLDGSR